MMLLLKLTNRNEDLPKGRVSPERLIPLIIINPLTDPTTTALLSLLFRLSGAFSHSTPLFFFSGLR
jgi:hypothetical protein